MRLMTARDLLDTALSEPNGYCIVFQSEEDAKRMRLAAYQVRSRTRRNNEKIYGDEVDYIPHTEWDGIKFDIKFEDGLWLLAATHTDLYLERTRHGPLTPEQLARFKSGQPIGLPPLPEVDKPSPVDGG